MKLTKTSKTGVFKYIGKTDTTLYIKYMLPNGKQKQERIGKMSDGYTIAIAAEKRAEKIRGLSGDKQYFPEGNLDLLMDDGYKEFIKIAEANGLRQIRTIKSYYRNHIKPALGDKMMSQVTPGDITDLKYKMLKKNLSPYTIQGVLGDIKRMYNHLIENGKYSGTNPMYRVKMVKKSDLKERLRYLTPKEATHLLGILKDLNWEVWAQATMSLYTGMRKGEVLSIQGHWIDLKRNLILIRNTKSGDDRDVPINTPIRKILMQMKFQRGERIWSTRQFRDQVWWDAIKRSGLNNNVEDTRDKVVFHTFRHTFATWLAMQGATLREIQYKMGHKSISQTERYAKYMPSQRSTSIEDELAKLMGETVEEPETTKEPEKPQEEAQETGKVVHPFKAVG
jgi:integrase